MTTVTPTLDPELCPKGHGCFHCHEGSPEEGFNWGKLCFGCIAAWFPGWPGLWVRDWLARQRLWFDRLQERSTPAGRQLTLWES